MKNSSGHQSETSYQQISGPSLYGSVPSVVDCGRPLKWGVRTGLARRRWGPRHRLLGGVAELAACLEYQEEGKRGQGGEKGTVSETTWPACRIRERRRARCPALWYPRIPRVRQRVLLFWFFFCSGSAKGLRSLVQCLLCLLLRSVNSQPVRFDPWQSPLIRNNKRANLFANSYNPQRLCLSVKIGRSSLLPVRTVLPKSQIGESTCGVH